MTDEEYWQAIYEAAKARDRNTDKFTENPYKRASDADKLKAEIKHLNTIVERLDEFEKCRKCPAWSGTDCTRNPYTEGCLDDKVNLKNEIKRLEKENRQLKTECALLDNELRIARQDTVDVLNRVKEKMNNTPNGWAYTTYIDELIKGEEK